MKKHIGIALGLMLIATPIYASSVQEQYVSALQQVIILLEEQVQSLLQQLNALQVSSSLTPVDLTTINPVVVPQPIVFGNSTSIGQSAIIPVMKPAYTLDELLQVLYNRTDKRLDFTFNRYFPVGVYPEANSVTFGWSGDYINRDEVKFNGNTVLSKDTNQVQVNNLIPNTKYTYQFIWHESGREDTIIEREFNTLP